ncbi:hypothetical protein [uncultured Methanobrevibacter sp.]|uniref:hypothetical protein n=1 Tax=uncultured Methanobrevibacter sp. TaxID=253161 RepID=UPI0025E71B56|nr:hypothetical protein [uncultured Methanobrevibacter sp.]
MNKKIIIIGIILLIIVAAIVFIILTTVNYETIEITPNGTTIDVPANQTKYNGKVEGAKIWNWNSGILVAYNSYEENDIIKVTEIGFEALNKIVKTGEMETVDGITCYLINADKLLEIHIFDIIKVNYNGKFYCIPLYNETTHDSIIICCKDKDIALHMAKSVKYKKVYSENNNVNNTISKVKNVTEGLESEAKKYANNTELNDVKSTIEDKAGDILSKSPI